MGSWRWLLSVVWLAIKIAVIVFCLSPRGATFIYQNF